MRMDTVDSVLCWLYHVGTIQRLFFKRHGKRRDTSQSAGSYISVDRRGGCSTTGAKISGPPSFYVCLESFLSRSIAALDHLVFPAFRSY